MKHIHNTIFLSFLLLFISCSQDEELQSQAPGYLSISEISLISEGVNTPLTKAVDEALRVEIWQNGKVVPGQSYKAGSVPEQIALSPGTYILKALSLGYGENVANDVKGRPAYYNEYPFMISTGDRLAIKLTVPMRNVGVLFAPSDTFLHEFREFTIKVEDTEIRSCTFTREDYATAGYFNIPESESLSYTITAVNTDNETVGPLQKSVKVKEGTIYTLALDIE